MFSIASNYFSNADFFGTLERTSNCKIYEIDTGYQQNKECNARKNIRKRRITGIDQAILGTLVAAKADYLITGDKALLALAERYPVLAAAQFWQMHGAA